MQSGAFLDTILRNVPVCALTSSRLYNFSNIVTYILTYSVMIPMHITESEVVTGKSQTKALMY